MIIADLDKIVGTDKEVGGEHLGWTSRRLLLKSDGMGYSVHDTLVHPGKPLHLHYKHHLEAVYCIEGKAELLDLKTGERHLITPGRMYALNENDKHVLTAQETTRFVCVFNPPLTGEEVHGEDGAYPPADP